jgi:hypothetical protein
MIQSRSPAPGVVVEGRDSRTRVIWLGPRHGFSYTRISRPSDSGLQIYQVHKAVAASRKSAVEAARDCATSPAQRHAHEFRVLS